MSKSKIKSTHLDLSSRIMTKILDDEIVMKPRWYFWLGSILSFLGLILSSLTAIYLINLLIFISRPHGPNGQWRLEQIITSYSWWIPLIAIVGIVLGVHFLKQYEFSYKKNFLSMALLFIASLIFAGLLVDFLGINDLFVRGPMRRLYDRQNLNQESSSYPRFRRNNL